MGKKAYVIRHIAFEDLGSFEQSIRRGGYDIQYIEAGFDDISFIKNEQPDLLIILGGPISVYDYKDYPFLLEEIAILKDRIKHNMPTLGICLGAQLIANALGAKVYSGGKKEIGWSKLMLTAAGQHNYFKHFNTEATHVLHWHGDTFDLPTGAVLQASTEIYPNQAFTYGNNILALQFHPEVTSKGMEKWFIGHAGELNSEKLSVQKLREDTTKYAEQLNNAAGLFINQ